MTGFAKPVTTCCNVVGCTSPTRTRKSPYCETHYYRLRRTGTTADPQRIEGKCHAEGCSKEAKCNGAAADRPGKFYCRLHYLRIKKRGDESFEFKGPNSPRWTGDAATSRTVHQRLRKERGSAREHYCVDCGRSAAHWSYDHQADDERHDPEKGPYTTDISHYQPRCVSCHKRFDLAQIKIRRSRCG